MKILISKITFLIIALFSANALTQNAPTLQQALAELEASSGGRIGISAVNTGNNSRLQYRAQERFPMGCTSKVIGVAAILKKSMSDNDLLGKKMTYNPSDLVDWSPITEKGLKTGMTVQQLCAASITHSDNTAMNLLVKKMGGLQEINAFARSIDDNFFRQDQGWPEEAMSGGPGSLQDSTTPAAMENSLRQLAFGDVLDPTHRELLLTWMKNNTTGNARIRAGVPKGWIVGDKTGTGSQYGTTNDMGIIWPPNGAPIVMVVYYTNDKKEAVKREDIVASATRIVLNEFSRGK